MQRLSRTAVITLFANMVVVLAVYNGFTSADLFRSHIPRIPQARGFVMVVDLPDTPSFQQSSGEYINLGYKFDPLSGGEWVGLLNAQGEKWRVHKYVNHYVEFDSSKLHDFLRHAGIATLPPVPPRPWATLFVDLILATLLLGAIATLIKNVLNKFS